MKSGVMVSQQITINGNVSFEVKDSSISKDIKIKYDSNVISLNLERNTYDYLGQAMFPEGLIPDGLHAKVALFNKIKDELDSVICKNDPDWQIDEFIYDEDADTVFCTYKEVE